MIRKSINKRYLDNQKILEKLSLYLEQNQDIRFIQALWNLKIITSDNDNKVEDRYNEEPSNTLKRVTSMLTKITDMSKG